MPEWSTAADWNASQSETGVHHNAPSDTDWAPADEVEKGYDVQDADLEAFWAFHENAGTTAHDVSGNDHDGTINGAAIGGIGLLGSNTYDFDASARDNVEWPGVGGGSFFDTTTDFTLAFWLYPNDDNAATGPTPRKIVHAAGSYDVFVEIAGDDDLVFGYETSGGTRYAAEYPSGQFAAYTWYNVVCVCDSSADELRLYVNGALQDTVDTSGASGPASLSAANRFGDHGSGSEAAFDGRLGEPRVYSRAFTTADAADDEATAVGTSAYWSSKKTAAGNQSGIAVETDTVIPAGASVTLSLYEDVSNDDTGGSTDALGNNYEHVASETLDGGQGETTTLTGYDGGGSTNAYWLKLELAGDGADPTVEAPRIQRVDATTTTPTVTGTAADVSLDAPSAGVTTSASIVTGTAADVSLDAPSAGVSAGRAGLYGSSQYGALPYGATTAVAPTITGTAADVSLDAPSAGVTTGTPPAVDAWEFDGEPLPRFVDAVREWQRLTLTFDVTPSQYTLALEPLESGAGNVRVLEAADGSYRATDTAGGAATVTVSPPSGQADVRRSGEYRVEELRREQSDHRGTGRVTLVLVPTEPKPLPSSPVQETRASGEWGVRFQTGTVATNRVEAEVLNQETPGATGGGYEVGLLLTPAETRTVEGHVSRLGAVGGVSPPGGTGVTTDDSVDDRLTVRVTSPSGGKPPSGGWIITDWSTEYLTDDLYRVSLRVEGAGADANVPGTTQPSDPDTTIESPWVVTGDETVTGTTTVTGTPPSGVTTYASPFVTDDETTVTDDETTVIEDQS